MRNVQMIGLLSRQSRSELMAGDLNVHWIHGAADCAASTDPPRLLHNEDKSNNHWIAIRLVGVHCNRDGIGARVRVTANGRTILRDQQLAGGYLSAHDPRLHFGLGQAGRIEKIEVLWPDGHTDIVGKAPLDRFVEITEGKGLTKGGP
jgi:hypothetical protein